jgi:uncharacterized protein (DUF427 family)
LKAIWNDTVIAEAPKSDLIYIEGMWYFPPDSVKQEYLKETNTPCQCHWRGLCKYFSVGQNDSWSEDNAWSYQDPPERALDIIKKDFKGYFAFWRDVKVGE